MTFHSLQLPFRFTISSSQWVFDGASNQLMVSSVTREAACKQNLFHNETISMENSI